MSVLRVLIIITHLGVLRSSLRWQYFVETSDNPFDSGKSITGLGNKKSANGNQKERQRQLEWIEEKDPNIKAELKKGNIVQIIEDSLTC